MLNFFYNTLTPWQWALLALVPPAIIALYFLKLRRQPLEVPSTYLWKRTIEDLHVNSLWQRLRHNLLLFLQLLLIALVMIALLRPGWEGTKLDGDRFIFLVDNSASMSATDAENAKNRLEAAKTLVSGLIDQLDPGMTAMIISFADTPQVVQEFTDNRRLLRERLATIQPTVRGTDLHGALDLADGLANPGRITTEEGGAEIDVVAPQPATIYIFSDGRFEDVKGFSLGNLTPYYVPIGSLTAANLAITAFTTRRSDAKPEERQAFVQVANLTDAAHSPTVEIQLDGNFLDARQVEVPAGESSGVVFPLADAPAGTLRARLKYDLQTPTKRDVLEQDDTGYAALNDAKPGKVLLVSPGNLPVEIVLATQRAGRLAEIQIKTPEVLASDEYKRDADGGTYDLIIYDQCAPAKMPRADTLFVGRLPPAPAWHESKDASNAEIDPAANPIPASPPEVVALPQIIDWDRSHPLLSSVELGNVDVGDCIVLEPPSGATVLIESTAGPIAAIAPRDAHQDAVLGFEIVGKDKDGDMAYNTTWPRRLSFPTFWLNVLEHLAGGTEDSQIAAVRPGRPAELRTAGNVPELTVVDPAGTEFTVRRAGEDVFQFHDTNLLGVYEVRRGDQVTERFAVNLFDRQESDVRLRPSQDAQGNTVRPADIRIGNVDVAASVGRTPTRKEAWKIVLSCALFVLVIEWYIYNRRVYM
jgi:Aerotolerance regulator N-terminal/von Willebrand factor type A domain